MIGAASPSPLRIALALGAVYVIWGSTYLAIAVAIESLPPFSMAGVRFLVSGLILYAWARARGEAHPSRAEWRASALIGGLLLLGGNGGVVWAEQRVSSGVASLLVSMMPLWMVLFRWMQHPKEKPPGRVWLGISLGFLGLALLVRPWEVRDGDAAGIDLLGSAALMLACISWAWGSITSRQVPLPTSPLMSTGAQMLTGGALLLLFGTVVGEPARFDPSGVTGRSLAALLYLVTFGSLIGFTAYIWLLQVAHPVLVSTYAYVNPIVAVFLGWLILDEPVGPVTIGAASIILLGVALITLAGRATRRRT